jgi:hypothetical protein
VESWLSFLKEFEPEVQILLCERCHENPSVGVCRLTGNRLISISVRLWTPLTSFLPVDHVLVCQARYAHKQYCDDNVGGK